jgi:hypothetical protein
MSKLDFDLRRKLAKVIAEHYVLDLFNLFNVEDLIDECESIDKVIYIIDAPTRLNVIPFDLYKALEYYNVDRTEPIRRYPQANAYRVY